jgi:arylsulfatase A-like enzyme
MSKNIVILMSDEQRWDSLGCNGSTAGVTPNIDALAARGASLNGYTPYPLCCPSRTSLWTGLLPHRHEVHGNWRTIKPALREQGLFGAFAKAGYHTIYSGKWHVPGTTPDKFHIADASAIPAVIDGKDRGQYIEEYREYAKALGYPLLPGNISNLTAQDVAHLRQPGKAPCGRAEIAEEHFLETWQTSQFLDALDRRPKNKPFFSVCCYSAPHFPMIVPAPYDTKVSPETVDLPANFLAGVSGKPAEVTRSHYYTDLQNLDEAEWRKLYAHYLGLCALIDTQVGRVNDYLAQTGLLQDTIIVFVSDHGDMIGSHGLNQKGFVLHYEEALKVPLVIVVPGSEPQPASDRLVSLMDLVPTLAELAGVQPDEAYEGIDGRSFAGMFDSRIASDRREYVVAETFLFGRKEGGSGEHTAIDRFQPDRDSMNMSIRTTRYRYIFRWNDMDELYDLQADPFENDNIRGEPDSQPVIRELREKLLAELHTCPGLQEKLRARMESIGMV